MAATCAIRGTLVTEIATVVQVCPVWRIPRPPMTCRVRPDARQPTRSFAVRIRIFQVILPSCLLSSAPSTGFQQ